jgi:predicted  nucleic acid-binding Zn-ribbon protein
MDGWHRLKTPALFLSMFLQATAIFVVIHASSSSEILGVYRWELLTCLLLSIMSLSFLFAHREREEGVYHNLTKGLHELENHLIHQSQEPNQGLFQRVSDNIKILGERCKNIYDSLVSSHDEMQKINNRLARVLDQSRECSQLSAHARLDWKKTKLSDPLAQVRQNLDNLLDLARNLSSTNASTLRLIHESLQSDGILRDKIVRAQEHLERIHYSAYHGSKIHEAIFSVLSETRDNISGAHKSVSSLMQKWDQLLGLTEQIDEVAQQINAQSVAASMEMNRGQAHQTVTDLFPFGNELRILAAQFHTFAHHIKEAIHDGREELQKASQYLSQAASKSDHVFVPVNQCGEYLRNGVAAVKYSASELTLLQMEVNIHMNKLQETYNMGVTTADIVSSMDRSLLNHSNFSKKVLEESGQSAMHSERIAMILTKQFHELNHCQKILSHNGPLMSESLRFATELKQTVSTLELYLEKAQPRQTSDPLMTLEPKKSGEVQVTCWKISSS